MASTVALWSLTVPVAFVSLALWRDLWGWWTPVVTDLALTLYCAQPLPAKSIQNG